MKQMMHRLPPATNRNLFFPSQWRKREKCGLDWYAICIHPLSLYSVSWREKGEVDLKGLIWDITGEDEDAEI